MLNDLYSQQILQAASALPPERRLEAPSATARKVSRICGSEVTVDLLVDGAVVTDFGLSVRACALGQAAASIVAQNIVGEKLDALLTLRDDMRAMLKDGGPPPSLARHRQEWAPIAALEGVRAYPQRHASVMLVFEAVAACVDQIRQASMRD